MPIPRYYRADNKSGKKFFFDWFDVILLVENCGWNFDISILSFIDYIIHVLSTNSEFFYS